MDKFKLTNYIFFGILSIVVFVVLAQFSQIYSDDLKNLMLKASMFAPIAYIGITILSIVVAPLGSGFLVPLAANSFGPFITAIYSITGWFIGSIIAFYLAREYGHGKLQQLNICKKIKDLEVHSSKLHLYFVIILLRTAMPVDIMSYALGLFSSISYKTFIWTTIVGISPFAFLFSYASVLPIWTQVVVSLFSVSVFLYAVYFIKTYKPKL